MSGSDWRLVGWVGSVIGLLVWDVEIGDVGTGSTMSTLLVEVPFILWRFTAPRVARYLLKQRGVSVATWHQEEDIRLHPGGFMRDRFHVDGAVDVGKGAALLYGNPDTGVPSQG